MKLQRCNLLLVDDIKANTQILAKVLGDEHDIASVQDGKSALEYIAANPTDLILLDILMPGMDGYEVCRRLKADEKTKDIPVIFITSMDEEADESKGLELGAVDYITKPFSKAIVRARVKNHLLLKKQRDLLRDLSAVDGLTGIANRRRFDEFVEIEWGRAVRAESSLSLIMMDIDFFKHYNDNYGHAVGDECLKQVATALAEALRRPSDFVARYGGEEFVAVLPETDSKGAHTMARVLRKKVADLNIPHAHSPVAEHVTISLGAAVIIPPQGTSVAVLINTADNALYASKKKGRNTVMLTDLNITQNP